MAGLVRSALRRGFASSGAWGPGARWRRPSSRRHALPYQDLFEPGSPGVPWRKITSEHVSVVEAAGRKVRKVEPEAIRLLAQEAMTDIAHLLGPGHLQQLANILEIEANNDRYVALELLKNANVAAGMVLPGCQDTGTAIIMGKRGQNVWTDGNDEEMINKGVYDTYVKRNLRYCGWRPRRC